METKLQEKKTTDFHCIYCREKREGGMSDPFKSKALFGMKNVGVYKFWKCLSVHNKLDTVDLPFPTSISFSLPPPLFLWTHHVSFHTLS